MADFCKLTILLLTLLVLSPSSVDGGPTLYGVCIATCYTLYYFGCATLTAATGGAGLFVAIGTALATSGQGFSVCAAACTPLAAAPTP